MNYYTEEQVIRLLKEQHRNTRHDAIGAAIDANDEEDGCAIIMNLKERFPPLPEPIKQEPHAWIHRVTNHITYKEPDYINAHGYEPLYKSPQPIQVPTEEEINEMYPERNSSGEYLDYNMTRREGAKDAINYIKSQIEKSK